MQDNIMIGTWAWGAGVNGARMIYGNKRNPDALRKSFQIAVENGFLKWDTAAVYGMGTCESFLGELMENRPEVIISTKFFPKRRYKYGELSESFEDSMKRLRRKSADIFWIHFPNNLTSNLKEAIALVKAGRIKSIGISNVSLTQIILAKQILEKQGLKLGAVQNRFSLLIGNQNEIIRYCNSNGIEYYAFMVLEQGALSGRYSAKNHFPTFSVRNVLFPKCKFKRIEGLLKTMSEIAAKHQVDSSQIPILWALEKGTKPIVGITKPSQVMKLVEAMEVQLSGEEIELIDRAASLTGLIKNRS